MKLSGTQIRSLIEKKEDERVEFKRALIHADYHGRRGIVVEKQFRTITFSNPGTMRVSKSVAVAGGTSDARNSAIFNIFALVDIGERSGMGLANLHGLWKKYGYAEPKITESYDPDRTVLVVTTDDDTVNDTVTRPEPDQNLTRTRPEVRKRGSVSERFSHGLENEYRSQIGLETWGDNNDRGDIKVDNKVDINVWDDTVNRSRINIETIDDTVNDTVKRPQTRTRTTIQYNTRTISKCMPPVWMCGIMPIAR